MVDNGPRGVEKKKAPARNGRQQTPSMLGPFWEIILDKNLKISNPVDSKPKPRLPILRKSPNLNLIAMSINFTYFFKIFPIGFLVVM